MGTGIHVKHGICSFVLGEAQLQIGLNDEGPNGW